MKQWLKRFFYEPRHAKPTDENIMRLLTPSILGIILCMVCLAGATWAWFSDSIQTGPQTITAASYDLKVSIRDSNGESVEAKDGKYQLNQGDKYTVQLTPTGTAEKGYCKIEDPDHTTYYTDQIERGKDFTFTLIPDQSGQYTFTAVWGTHSVSEGDTVIVDKGTIGETPSEGSPVPEQPAVTEEDQPTAEAAPVTELSAPEEEETDPPAGENTEMDAAAEPETDSAASDAEA